MKKILQGLSGLKIVGADIVEVAPGKSLFHRLLSLTNIFTSFVVYDTQDEITQIAAANIGWDLLALMAKAPLVA